MPCPENLIKKIPINNKDIDDIFEKKKEEKDSNKITNKANFEIFSKVHAKGETTEPYTTLNKLDPTGDVSWNFEKFLVGKDGIAIARFQPSIQPSNEELVAAIEVALDF